MISIAHPAFYKKGLSTINKDAMIYMLSDERSSNESMHKMKSKRSADAIQFSRISMP